MRPLRIERSLGSEANNVTTVAAGCVPQQRLLVAYIRRVYTLLAPCRTSTPAIVAFFASRPLAGSTANLGRLEASRFRRVPTYEESFDNRSRTVLSSTMSLSPSFHWATSAE